MKFHNDESITQAVVGNNWMRKFLEMQNSVGFTQLIESIYASYNLREPERLACQKN